MKIIGHGICGAGEADKFMELTLESFRLCDNVIILLNNATEKEKSLVRKFKYDYVEDNREWGKKQNIIKQDFVSKHVSRFFPDACLTLDMDESLQSDFKRSNLEQLTRWHSSAFYFVQHWNSEDRYNPDFGFWSVRFYNWKNDTRFLNRPLQCGLVPRWALNHCSYAPYFIHHYGLMSKEDRDRKIARYEKYDPEKKYLPSFYEKLKSKSDGIIFNEVEFKKQLTEEVAKYGDQFKTMESNKDEKYWYVKNPHGKILDIPDRHLKDTLLRPGFTLLSKEPITLTGDNIKSTTLGEAKEKIELDMIKDEGDHPQELVCDVCKFEAKSVFGLRVHRRKHG